ncbi:MAG: hypothetical protein V1806_10540 [Pseudomonadota bacterium]
MPQWWQNLPGAWRRGAYLTALLLALHLSVWPLVWRLVIVPSAGETPPGLRVEERALTAPHGPPHRTWRAGPQDLALERPRVQASALAVWRVPVSGVYGLRLAADDFASLSLDRRLLIEQPEIASDFNQAEGMAFLEAGPHLLRLSLTNLDGRGWLRLQARPPGEEHWRELPPAQLRPPDLGNLDFWLGLVAWLEGLCLWGLWGSLLALPLLLLGWPRGDGADGQRAALARRLLKALTLAWVALPAIVALARRWPARVDWPYLTTYGPDLRLPALGLMVYALFIGLAVHLAVRTWRRRLLWGGLLLGLVATRVYAWPYSMHCGLHADWASFAGFFEKFYDLFSRHHLASQASLSDIVSYLIDVARNLYVGYPSGCFSFPAFLMGAAGLAAQAALSGSGAVSGFSMVGHFLGPAFNLAYALLLALLGRRYLWREGEDGWSWCLGLLLCLLPTHIYLGANITYNLLADALHLALLLAGLAFMERWQALLAPRGVAGAPGQDSPWRPLVRWGLLCGLLLGLCLATKLVFLPALLTLLVYTGALMWRYRQGRPALVWGALPGSLLAVLALGGAVYGLIIIRNVLNVPGFWRLLLAMTGDNTGLSLSKVGLWRCLEIFIQDLLCPNLGHAGTLAGGLGLALLTWRALKGRGLALTMVWLWAVLCLGLNLLSGSMLLMFNAMPRSSMVLGLWLALGLYLVKALWDWATPRLGRLARVWLKGLLVGALGLELALAGLCLLVMYGAGAPRWQAEGFLRTLAGSSKSVASVMFIGHGDDPNTVLGRQVIFKDLRRRAGELGGLDNCRRIIAETGADYWLLTSYEAFFLGRHQADAQALVQALGEAGYVLERRCQSRPFAGRPWLQDAYQHFLGPLMGGPVRGGAQEPDHVDIYARVASKEAGPGPR